jgi:hypothetical protein
MPTDFDTYVWHIAKEAYAMSLAYAEAIGENSLRSWDELDTYTRERFIANVSFVLKDPIATPKELHEFWRNALLKAGWKLGPYEDSHSKTHPCLVLWGFLPEEQQVEYALFIAFVRSAYNLVQIGKP